VIHGGSASNIIPDYCEIKGECRSHDDAKLAHTARRWSMRFKRAPPRRRGRRHHARPRVPRLSLAGRAPVVRLAKAAVAAIGLEPRLVTGGGGSDANVLNARGLATVNLDAGMMQVHSADEYVTLDDLERLCRLALEMIRLAPEFGPHAS